MPHPPPIPHDHHIPPPGPPADRVWGTARRPPAPGKKEIVLSSLAPAHPQRWQLRPSRESLRSTSSFLTSLVVHCIGLIVLALFAPATRNGNEGVALVVDVDGDAETPVIPENLSISVDSSTWDTAPLATALPQPAQVAEAPEIASPFAAPTPVSSVSRPTAETRSIPLSSLLVRSTLPVGGGIEGRTQQQRSRLAGERGGTAASEQAVELALVWLAAHQRPDGSWSLKLDSDACRGMCSHPGHIESNTGATALALLPFLGAGYSHRQGPHQEVVKNGLYYLTTRMLETEHGGDFTENVTMYAQGLAALALCEGLAMTGDEHLRPFAQKSIDFICYAQHPRGGWRYFPGQPGDTTVTGWQVMALKSARLARLAVPSQSVQRVQDFLDNVQEAEGAFYGYQTPGKLPGPTSVGLLLRMYYGWQRDDPRLMRGVQYLTHQGPSPTDVYFDYYATQVVSHFGGPAWEKWNDRMRDHLVGTQSQSGHERGSWFFPDKHGSVGGRLYTTAMCVMILEVYYRYMPLYGEVATADSF